jgi:hypothetical protein
MQVTPISSWQDLLSKQKRKTLYRGQENVTWELETTLERSCRKNDGGLTNATERERRLILLFKRHYHEYSYKPVEYDDDLRWLGLMQHHGAPTRLLDWSYSILVATFFAIGRAVDDAAVWCIDNDWLRQSAQGSLDQQGISDSSLNVARGRVSRDDAKRRFSQIYMTNKYRVVRAVSPFFRDSRLTAQQGTFLCLGDVSAPFMENLTGMGQGTDGIIKYVIKKDLFRGLLYELYAANISNATLFPGLDGYARMLNTYHPTVWD